MARKKKPLRWWIVRHPGAGRWYVDPLQPGALAWYLRYCDEEGYTVVKTGPFASREAAALVAIRMAEAVGEEYRG